MSVRIKRYGTNVGAPGDDNATEYIDEDFGQRRVIDNEGYEYVFGPNEARNFLDDGRGLSTPSSDTSLTNIQQDAIPFGSALS